MKPSVGRTAVLTTAAMAAFAANSLLCRAALREPLIGAEAFTLVRVASGAAVLALLVAGRRGSPLARGGWAGATMLVLYAAGFSLAYRSLPAGTGALILFGTVQVTMLGWSVYRADGPRPREWCGLVAATSGLVVLNLPALAAPPLGGALLMAAAGVGWGAYSLIGRGSTDPLGDSAGNFVRGVPLAGVAAAAGWMLGAGGGGAAVPDAMMGSAAGGGANALASATARGVGLAIASGALTSGVGYAIWYAALRGLTRVRAGLIQLSVPVLAAAAGVVLLDEPISLGLVVASALILGGVAVALVPRRGD
ncbi:MAG: DMT family transporter [Phycisphaerales bacterium]